MRSAQDRRVSLRAARVAALSTITCVALTLHCTGRARTRVVDPGDLAWPAGDPRIRLVRVIELAPTAKQGRGKLRRWLALEAAGNSFIRPYAVAWDGDDILVADPDSTQLARIDLDGRIKLSRGGLMAQPVGLAVCETGIVASDSRGGRVALLDRALRLVRWLAEDLSRPTGVCCDEQHVFVSETGEHRILVLGPGGERRVLGGRGTDPGQFNFPTSLVCKAGDLFVADAMNFQIQRINAETGRSVAAFGELGDAPGSMPRLKGLAVDSANRLWMADAYLDQLSIYDLDGTHLISIGTTGEAPGEFSFPAGIAAHADGRVVVADSLNRRLVVFRLLERAGS